MRQRLTDLSIKQLPHPESGNQKVWDEAMPGFGIRLTKGSKSFIVMYGPDRRLKTLGRYPAISLREARRAAAELLDSATANNSPLRVAEAVQRFLTRCEKRNRPRTVRDYRRHLSLYLPEGRLSEISPALMARQLEPLTDRPGEHRHAFLACQAFFNDCIHSGLLDLSPLRNMKAPPPAKARNRILTDQEIAALWQYEEQPYSTIVRLLILTGQRRGETSSIKPEWIKDDWLVFPSSATKNGHEHRYPITDFNRPYIEAAPFTFNSWSKAKLRMDKATGVSDYTLHDLRRTYISTHSQLQTRIEVAEKLVNHVSGNFAGVRGVYDRYSYLNEMRETATLYEKYICDILRT